MSSSPSSTVGRGGNPSAEVPVYEADLFTDEAIAEPYDHYRALRDLGPVVRLGAHGVYALPRYAEVRAALFDHETFRSGEGVMVDPDNETLRTANSTLTSDGDLHERFRGVAGRDLTPKALRGMQGRIMEIAEGIVDEVLERGEIDGVSELAARMPLTVVPEIVGWDPTLCPHLLRWSAATFDLFGPANQRRDDALPVFLELIQFAADSVRDRAFTPDSAGTRLMEAADRGEITEVEGVTLLIDQLAPSLDTTISALGTAVSLFATHPDQWQQIRSDPGLIRNAFNEAVRWQSPIRTFARVTTAPVAFDGVEIPEGERVLMMFASANRDERAWERPEEFDVRRDASGQVGFGYGIHACMGQGLARLEAQCLFTALARRVREFVPLGPPVLTPNNLIRAYGSVPVRVVPA